MKKNLLVLFTLVISVLSASAQGIYVTLNLVNLNPNCGVSGISSSFISLPDSSESGSINFQMAGALNVYSALIPTTAEAVVIGVCAAQDPACGGSFACTEMTIYANTTNIIMLDFSLSADNDGDGYTAETDCDDTMASVNPGAEEICDDFLDNNCNGAFNEGCGGGETDNDNDGFTSAFDCNDNDSSINPNAVEICGDSIDNNCNIFVDEGCGGGGPTDFDMDGYYSNSDCNDNDYLINPGMPEICADLIDNNCNGVVDEEGCTGGGTGGCTPEIVLVSDSAIWSENPGVVWIIFPMNPSNTMTYLWDFGDGTSSSQPFPTNVYELDGTYTVCLTVIDANGCTGVTCVTFTVTPEGDFLPGGMPMTGFTLNVVPAMPNAVDEVTSTANLSIFPNPIQSSSTLSWSGMPNEQGTFEVITMDGRIVYSTTIASLAGARTMTLPTDELAGGVYTARLRSLSGVSKTIQFVK